jgi:hypothetical protein
MNFNGNGGNLLEMMEIILNYNNPTKQVVYGNITGIK